MFLALRQTHIIVVTLFFLIYLVKTVLLLMNKTEALEKVKKITKIPEMIISVLFLGTGIYLVMNIPEFKSLLIIKLVAVALSIPLAVVGFKKNNKVLALLAFLLITGAYGLAEMSKKQKSAPADTTKETKVGPSSDTTKVAKEELDPNGFNVARAGKLYNDNCAKCHGSDGKLGLAGAKDLTVSAMDAMDAKDLVTTGKSGMPGVGDFLNSEEINGLVNYIQKFKQKK
ncbi:MAG: c-type cytochrome [Bacteroidia bacterium]